MMAPDSRTSRPSDLTPEQWQAILPWLPDEKPAGRHRVTNLREVLNAIIYREEMGCPWRMLPGDFPPWGTVYRYFRRWNQDGTLARLRSILKPQATAPSATSLCPNSQSIEQSA